MDQGFNDLLGITPSSQARQPHVEDFSFDPNGAGSRGAWPQVSPTPVGRSGAGGAQQFSFDPNFGSGANYGGGIHGMLPQVEHYGSGQAGLPQAAPGPAVAGTQHGAASVPSAAGQQRQHGAAPVDPEELKRRIQGSGSEAPSFSESAQRHLRVCRKSACQAAERCKDRALDAAQAIPRWKVATGMLVLLLLAGGCFWYMRAASAALPDDTVIVVESARDNSRGSRSSSKPKVAELDGADEIDESDTRVSEAANEGDEQRAAGKSHAAPLPGKADLESVRQDIADLSSTVRDVEKNLRQEIAELRAALSAVAEGESGAMHIKDMPPQFQQAGSVGQVHSERRGSERSGSQSRSSSDSRERSARVSSPRQAKAKANRAEAQRSEEDDDRIGGVGEVRG